MNHATAEDAFNLMCGERLGSGIHREVFECRLQPIYVVKVEIHELRDRSFANVLEYEFWRLNQHHTQVANWLAPCVELSPDGRILVQYRVDPLPLDYKLPERIPSFLNDIKRKNFGLFEGRLVTHDYASHIEFVNMRLRKTDWV